MTHALMRVFGYRPAKVTLCVALAAHCLAACGLPPESQHRIATCSARYAACVRESKSMGEYAYCRGTVDAECLDDGGVE